MTNILSISGSPVEGSSTEIILRKIAGSISEHLRRGRSRHTLVRLNDLNFAPCQACGEVPSPSFCFLEDPLSDIYKKVAACDCLLFGSPIYFDAVSAQAKAFIDRCNCFRPADFDNQDPEHDFIKRLDCRRPGAIVLVGGEQGWFEGARRCIAGFFKWVEVVNEGVLKFRSQDFTKAGEAADSQDVLKEADQLGRQLARLLEKRYARP
ncbi:MAG: flavodoxin family protein [bacterium]|nr:flavodoxin family protein [bacterium]